MNRKVSLGGAFLFQEDIMVKLYKYDNRYKAWVFVDYGTKSKVRAYTAQGYVVIYI
jgi:hypothetical protein